MVSGNLARTSPGATIPPHGTSSGHPVSLVLGRLRDWLALLPHDWPGSRGHLWDFAVFPPGKAPGSSAPQGLVLGRFLGSGSPMSGQRGPGLLELSGGPHSPGTEQPNMSCPAPKTPRKLSQGCTLPLLQSSRGSALEKHFCGACGRNMGTKGIGRHWGWLLAPNHWVEQRWEGFLSEFPRPDLLFFHHHIPDGRTDEMFVRDCSMGAPGWRGTRKPCTSSLCLQQPSGESGHTGWVRGTQRAHTHTRGWDCQNPLRHHGKSRGKLHAMPKTQDDATCPRAKCFIGHESKQRKPPDQPHVRDA